MLFCLLCLKKRPVQVKLNSKKGKALKCSSIIAQHFWLKPNAKNDSTESVCWTCWDVVLAFHNLYETVAEAHNYQDSQLIAIDSNASIKSKEEQQAYKLDYGDGDIEVKVEITDLELLPETEVMEDVDDDNEHIQRKLISPENDTNQHEEFSNFSDNDSKRDYPLSMLQHSTSEMETDAIGKSSEALIKKSKKKRNVVSSKIIQSTKADVRSENVSSLIIESYRVNGSTTFKSDKDLYSDYGPSEDNAPIFEIKRTMQKRLGKKRLEVDKNISKFFEKLQCSKCEIVVPDFEALIQHAQTAHNSKPAVQCCNRLFKMRKTLCNHVLTHLNPQDFTCSLCDITFTSNLLLEKHMKTNHRCSQCSKVFPNKQNLREHETVKHLPESEYKFECTECHARFPLKRRLWEHLNIAHNKGSPIICDKCGKRMRNHFALKRHMRSKHSEQPKLVTERVQCDECGKWLKHESSLRGHKYIVHEERSLQQCSICNKTMPSVRALERHVVHNHQKERKFKCPMCDRAFKDNRDLQQHINLHTKALVYTCNMCGKFFNQTSSLHKHKSVYHPNNRLEAPDPVQCNICNAWLKTLPGLKQHIKILHEGAGEHRCRICNNVSVNAMALKRHIKRNHGITNHNNEPPKAMQQEETV